MFAGWWGRLVNDRRGDAVVDFFTFIIFFPVLFFFSLVAFSIYAHGLAELTIANDARMMALETAYHQPAPCPHSNDLTQNLTCKPVTVTLQEDQRSVTVQEIDIRADTLTYGLFSSYIQAQAVVPSAQQTSL